jgi:perosamine synthetase
MAGRKDKNLRYLDNPQTKNLYLEIKELNNEPLDLSELIKRKKDPIISPTAMIGHQKVSPKNIFLQNPDLFSIGDWSIIDHFCSISTKVKIGKYVHITPHTTLGGGIDNTITIEDHISIAHSSALYTGNLTPGDVFTIYPREFAINKGVKGDINIGKYAAVGALSFISPDNNIPEGVFIGTHCFVPTNYKFEPWGVYARNWNKGGKLMRIRDRTPKEIKSTKKQALIAEKTAKLHSLLIKMSKKSYIPWWNPITNEKREKEFVRKVLDDNYPNDGYLTTQFEEKIKKLLKCKYAVAVTSGTTALFSSLKALEIGYGDEVIIPDVTFIATANAVEMTNAKPVLADVELDTANLDPISFERLITSKTKAVIPVHVSGRAANLKQIIKIAKKHNIAVIEDAAEALMSKYNNKYLGTLGNIGCYSLSPNKIITSGQGGITVTNNKKVYQRLREIKDQGSPKRGSAGFGPINNVGYNFKFTNLQAGVALAQLSYLKTRVKRMMRNHKLYKKYLKGIDGITLMKFDTKAGEIPQWSDIITNKPEKLVKAFEKNNIGYRRYWPPIHTQKPYKKPDKYFPNSNQLFKNALWLASAYTLTDSDIKYVCKIIKNNLH